MRRKTSWTWTLPIFIVLAIFSVFWALTLLPSETFSETWASISEMLWLYLPYLVVLSVAVVVLWRLTK